MNTQRNVLVITRHGRKKKQLPHENPDDASLEEESIIRLYHQGKALSPLIVAERIQPADIFIDHSPKIRTKLTGLARVAGAYQMQPVPDSQEALEALPFDGIETQARGKLDFADLVLNESALKAQGDEMYMTRWMAQPDSDVYDGMAVTPFNQFASSRKIYLANTIARLVRGEKRLGVLSTHGGVAEALITSIVNSSRSKPVQGADDIGGPVGQEGYAVMLLDGTPGGHHQARLIRNGEEYKVNLDRLRHF